MRLLITLLLSVLLLSQACTQTGARTDAPTGTVTGRLGLMVDPIPSELDTNVPKISGKVSDPNAIVYVNNNKAFVMEDGKFFTYLEIPPRVSTTIEVRAELSGQSTAQLLTTTFYPDPYVWVSSIDTHSDPAKMEGWVSYPDARVEITGNLKDPVVEFKEDGFFTARFSLTEGYVQKGDDRTHYDIMVNVITSRGNGAGPKFFGMTKNSVERGSFMLNDIPIRFTKVLAKRDKTVLFDMEFYYNVPLPTPLSLELAPDLARGAISKDLSVSIEPKSFLCYPEFFGTERSSMIIIKADDKVPSGSYFFRFLMSGIEVVVE